MKEGKYKLQNPLLGLLCIKCHLFFLNTFLKTMPLLIVYTEHFLRCVVRASLRLAYLGVASVLNLRGNAKDISPTSRLLTFSYF